MIGTVLDIGSSLVGLLKIYRKDDKDLEQAQKDINGTRRILGAFNDKSITATMHKSIVRPMVGIEQTIAHAEYGTDLMTIIQLRDMLAIMTHFEMMGKVGDISIKALMDTVNPSRNGFESLVQLDNIGGSQLLASITGNEAVNLQRVENDGIPDVRVGDNAYQNLTEYVPLALGRTVVCCVQTGKEPIRIPVTFRQIPFLMTPKDLGNVFEAAKIEDGFMARIDLRLAGLLTSPEIITGSDIVKDRFKIRMRDVTGMYEETIKRQRNNFKKTIATGYTSVNTMANTFIISDTTAKQIELKIGKRFDNANQRKQIWDSLAANTIVIVNESRGVFRFYTMGSDVVETYTRNEIKSKAKKESGVGSLKDLLELLNSGR